ncbi:ROK family protein [Labrys wisconsinensis]|uniref:Glucokinase n=1 Tax=Labrys wisconsinensis TaxID=425677 RepID=A0ABU0JJU4_9HYPH|nr:ROK family protein [Labrys wisconsinensis]MDQ0474548.1 glucokinase [Labrys wisconsinensis]
MPRLAIGLDLGGTQVRAALVDEGGYIQARAAVATAAAAGPEIVIDQLHWVAEAVSTGVPAADLAGIGVAAPGPLDTGTGTALGLPTLAGFVDLPLARLLAERFDRPVRLENDGIAAALGEWRFGAGRGHANLVYVTVSTGIGGGVVSDGRLLRGRRGMAGHVGHMTIMRDGAPCSCGHRGCWEAYGAGPAFARRAREQAARTPGTQLAGPIDARAVFEAAAAGDALAAALVAEEADILGLGIAGLLHLYSPEIVIVGGGVAHGFPALHPGIAARIRTAAMAPFRDVPVVRAALGDNAGLVGAAALAFEVVGDEIRTPLPLGEGQG